MRTPLLLVLALGVAYPADAASVNDAAAVALARPREMIVASDLSPARLAKLLKPVNAFYGFWTNGSLALLSQALSPRFVDHTLPPGRPQGPSGPASASKGFLGAIPDLKIAIVQRVVVKDRVVSNLRFTGHFTGVLLGVKGRGQSIDFIATDILRVRGGLITDNWHLEDNLTFLKQAGLVPN